MTITNFEKAAKIGSNTKKKNNAINQMLRYFILMKSLSINRMQNAQWTVKNKLQRIVVRRDEMGEVGSY